jgi:hypothetical protein
MLSNTGEVGWAGSPAGLGMGWTPSESSYFDSLNFLWNSISGVRAIIFCPYIYRDSPYKREWGERGKRNCGPPVGQFVIPKLLKKYKPKGAFEVCSKRV